MKLSKLWKYAFGFAVVRPMIPAVTYAYDRYIFHGAAPTKIDFTVSLTLTICVQRKCFLPGV